MNLSKKTSLLLLTVLFLLVGGCADDMLEYGPDGFPVGETDVRMSIAIEKFKIQNTGTRASLGNVTATGAGTVGAAEAGYLDDICIVIFDANGNLLDGYPIKVTDADPKVSFSDENRTNPDASNDKTSEISTRRADFTLRDIPYGKYFIYAVANMRNSSGDPDTYNQLKNTYSQEIKKRDDFLKIKRTYTESNYGMNCEMLGFFTEGESSESPGWEADPSEKSINIDRPNMTLHSWLRRTSAIVTLDFDGSELRDNIKIYIRRATIHNLPVSVYLGSKSAVQNASGMHHYCDASDRPSGYDQVINYSSGDVETEWNYIANGRPKLCDNAGAEINLHSKGAPCFCVYENLQGTGDETQQKPQVPDEDGLVKDRKEKYDNKELGTYIEVEGYYDLSSNTSVSRGPIRYRFMLGKNEIDNFDVERNYHYKITMKPRGNGNDVDWHIEYTEKNGWEVRNPYYVSYLYNHDSTLRFRYTPDSENEEVQSLDAEIVGNNWWPDNDLTYASSTIDTQYPVTGGKSIDADLREHPNKYADKFGRVKYTSGQFAGRPQYLGGGFLSLRATNVVNLTYKQTTQTNDADFNYTRETDSYVNDNYFYGVSKDASSNPVDRSKAHYEFASGDTGGSGREQYTMKKDANGNAVTFNIPVFTRAKNLVKKSGYTGNNPFEGSTRSAYVKLTVNVKNKITGTVSAHSEVVRVEQVKRIVNPKAIYRRAKNNENFHVILKERESEDSRDFIDVESDGPWMAEVLGDANFINLNGRQTIKGPSNSAIDFTVRFNKMNRDDRVRNAVIRIRYNNYSCVHLIFVRQGYNPVTIGSNSTLWRTFNLVADGVEATDPRDEGSLFKFGNISTPIDVASNEPYTDLPMLPETFYKNAVGNLYIANASRTKDENTKKAWNASGFTHNAAGFTTNNVATMKNFEELYYDPTQKIQQGFGVLYADGATETADNIHDAYEYCRYDEGTEKRGMRGIIVYYWDRNNPADPENYHSIFLPIGRAGYGHRRDNDGGRLRYCAGRTSFADGTDGKTSLTKNAPLFYDLFRRPGAIYYSRYKATGIVMSDGTYEGGNANTVCIGLDMNYFSFDFNCISESNVTSGASACFLRCVGASIK